MLLNIIFIFTVRSIDVSSEFIRPQVLFFQMKGRGRILRLSTVLHIVKHHLTKIIVGLKKMKIRILFHVESRSLGESIPM